VQRTSRELFIPLTVGGGLRTVEDIRTVLRAGADKVAINTAAIHTPELIRHASSRFGSSTITVSIEAKHQADGSYEAYVDNGRERTGVDVLRWVEQVVELGAGEILLTSIDREGTGRGYDIELTRWVAERVPVPVIAAGGAGNTEHVREVIVSGRADAVAMASLLHYAAIRCLAPSQQAGGEGNREFLRSGNRFSRIMPASLSALREHLGRHGIECRLM
jgi:cyclase